MTWKPSLPLSIVLSRFCSPSDRSSSQAPLSFSPSPSTCSPPLSLAFQPHPLEVPQELGDDFVLDWAVA